MNIKWILLIVFLVSCGYSNSAIDSMGQDKQGISPGPSRRGNDYRVNLTWLDQPGGNYVGGNYGRQSSFGGRDRFYEFHLPRGFRPDTQYPVVLVLHGGGGNPALARYQSGMDEIADREQFIAIYPAGTSPQFTDRRLFWNMGRAMTDPRQAQVDDVSFIATVVDDLAKYVTIDQQRVYATGISNGAQMCYRLIAELPDRIAAIGPIAGHFATNELPNLPDRPIPIIHFHGKRDPFARVDGKPPEKQSKMFRPYRIKPLPDVIQSWVKFNGCQPDPERAEVGQAQQLRFSGGREGAEVVLWLLSDGGHTWPGGKSTIVEQRFMKVGPVNNDISASQRMWDFFKLHPLQSKTVEPSE